LIIYSILQNSHFFRKKYLIASHDMCHNHKNLLCELRRHFMLKLSTHWLTRMPAVAWWSLSQCSQWLALVWQPKSATVRL